MQQILSVVAILLVNLLPYIGVQVESEAINSAIQTIVTIIGGIVIYYQRTFRLKEVAPGESSDVTVLGRKR